MRLTTAGAGRVKPSDESLRTVFETVEGRPVQRVLPVKAGFALPVVDLAALEPCRAEQEARRLAAAEAGGKGVSFSEAVSERVIIIQKAPPSDER